MNSSDRNKSDLEVGALGEESSRKKDSGVWLDNYFGPHHYWCVDYIECGVDKILIDRRNPEQDIFNESIGNWFDTEDEAWEVVEKLQALKRLHDDGFHFKKWSKSQPGTIEISCGWDSSQYDECVKKDLDLLFCTEDKS